ncbi:hypothetical protein [Candidiatus Paracoxiella cheracis]|uniref:hypothetical protein n=1 Tax=Candidiatus Paracoxiella cheracis TaxID=3405120 RepID=UPI003BF59F28
MTARKDFLQSLTLGKKSEPTAEYAPSLRSPWRASVRIMKLKMISKIASIVMASYHISMLNKVLSVIRL